MSSTEPSEKGDDFFLNFVHAGHYEGSKQLQHVKVTAKLTWVIDDFLTWAEMQEKTYCQTSTIYKMDFEKIGKTYSFSFDLYPKGDAKSEDDIALYIKNLSEENVNVTFKLQLIKKDGEPFEEKFSEQVLIANGSRGWRRFVSKKKLQDDPETLLPGGALTILCDLSIFSSEVINTNQNISEPDGISQECTELWKDMGRLLDVANFSDVALVCGDISFACHKNILTCRSDVFRTMFKAEEALDNVCKEVQIREFDPESVSRMIEYIYTDELKNPEDYNSVDLLLLSDKYNIVGLRRKCELNISKNLNLGNAIAHLSVAHRIAAPILLKNAATYIGKNLKSLVGTEDWDKLLKENPIALDAILKLQAKWQ